MVATIVALFNYWWLLMPMVTFLGIFWIYQDLWRREADWKRVNGWLIQNKPLSTYRRFMISLLNRLDARLSQSELEHGMGQGPIAFSSGLIQLTLILAAVYPSLLVVGQWLADFSIRFGELEIAARGGALERGQALVWLITIFSYSAILSGTIAIKNVKLWALTLMIILSVISLTWIYFFSLVFPTNLYFIFLALIIAIANFGDLFNDKGKSGGSAMFGGAVTLALFASFTRSNEYYLLLAISLCLILILGLALIIIDFERIPKSTAWATWTALVFSLIVLAIIGEPNFSSRQSVAVIFLTLLPFLNALSDFASIGLTRYLLRRGLSGWAPMYAALDLVGGVLIFALLGCASIALFHWVRPQDGVALIDLPSFFAGLEQTPEHYWWVFFMFFSTLIPTLVHGAIGTLTLLLHYPNFLRARVVLLLQQGQSYRSAGRLGTALWCGMLTLAVWLPIWALTLLLSYDHGALLHFIIAGFEVFARAIGAI